MKTIHILLLPILLLLVSCGQDTPTSVSPLDDELIETSLSKNSNIDVYDMNDRFSGSGAEGNGFAKVQNGKIDLRIRASSLEADHDYEVHLVVNVSTGTCDPFPVFDVLAAHIFPVTSDQNGRFNFKVKGFDLGLAPGSGPYRLDYVVVDVAAHAHTPCVGFDCLLLACQPASCVTI